MQGEEGVFTDSVFLQATCGAEVQVDWMLGFSFQVGLSLKKGTGQECWRQCRPVGGSDPGSEAECYAGGLGQTGSTLEQWA